MAVLTATVLLSTVTVINKPTVYSILPTIVHPENLIRANSFYMGVEYICGVLGAAFAGFFYIKFDLVNIILITVILHAISGIIILFMKLLKSVENDKHLKKLRFWNNFKKGLIYIGKEKTLLITLIFILVVNFFSNPFYEVLLPKIIRFSLHLGSNEFGFLKALFPLGSVVGLIICSMLPKRKHIYRTVFYYGLIVMALFQLLFGIPIIPFIKNRITGYDIFIFYCSIAFIKMVFDALINVPLYTVFQLRIPDKYRGRFFSLQNTALMGVRPLSVLLLGFISIYIASYIITLILGIILIFLVIWIILNPAVKDLFDIDL